MSQALEVQAPNALAQQLRVVKPYLEKLLPEPERFATTLMVLARRNEQLLRCDPASVVGAALVCAELNLEPGPAEHVWLIPRRNKKTNTIDCTLLLGYKGMKALAERHPAIASVRTGTVCEGDEFEHTAQPPSLRHVPKHGPDRGAPRLWYAVATRTDGDPPHIAVLDQAAVDERRKRSSSPKEGPWVTHYDAMARKSCIRALWSELPSSLDMVRAAAIDDAGGVITPQDLGVPAVAATPPPARALTTGRIVDESTGEILAEGPIDDEPLVDEPPLEDEPFDTGAQRQDDGTFTW